MQAPENIMVAIDFDGHSDFLIRYAALFAERFKARLWIVHIAAPDPDFVGYEVGPQYVRDMRAEDLRDEHRFLDQKADEYRERNLPTEALLIQGPTVQSILNEIEKLEIDLLIVGSHEHGFLYRTFAEDTALELFRQCQVPMLSIPFDRLKKS